MTHLKKRGQALAMLGLVATAIYAAPVTTGLREAKASGALVFFINDEITKKECSECHMAYDAGLMPKGAWKRLMGDLQNHFGEDASLDEETRAHIETYLVSRALRGDGPIRISAQPWFLRSHGRGFSFFSSDPAPSMADCNRCHGGG